MKTKILLTAIVLACTTLLFAQVQLPFQLPFTPYENNLVLENGDPGSWDDGYLLWSFMFTENDTCYLYYTATGDPYTQPGAIGLATSINGYDFNKSDHNPIFEPADLGFDMGSVSFPVVMKDTEDYVLYYNGRLNPDAAMGENVGRAIADNPEWPWEREEDPIIEPGSTGEWDSQGCLPESVIETDSGLLMYYTAGHSINHFRVGMAYLPEEGSDWIKFDDPNTTDHPFMESDPVLELGDPGDWDGSYAALCSVYKTVTGLEMFYTGYSAAYNWNIGYAVSEDGIEWIKYSENPIYTYQEDPLADIVVANPTILLTDDYYYMYYDYGKTGVVTGIKDISMAFAQRIPNKIDDHLGHSLESPFNILPNPVNSQTTIQYYIKAKSRVEISLRNLSGQIISTLVDEVKQQGHQEIILNTNDLSAGIYFCVLKTPQYTETKKIIKLHRSGT